MKRSLLRVVVLGLMTVPVASSQEPQSPTNARGTFASGTDLVVLHVNVRDKRGGWVSALDRLAFGVFEESRPQPISFFVAEDAPVTVGLLVDNSTSMRENRDLVVAAARRFAEASRADDELFGLVFNENVEPVLPGETPFTSDAATLGAALDRAIDARGQTAFFDAVDRGLTYVSQGSHRRQVLVTIGDGGDNASETTFSNVLHRAQAANVVIYALALVDPLDRQAKPGRLDELARLTGGVMFTPRGPSAVSEALAAIAADIRHTYTIGYASDRAPDGKYRRVRVVVTPPVGRQLVVRTRAGYLAEHRSEVDHGDELR